MFAFMSNVTDLLLTQGVEFFVLLKVEVCNTGDSF